MSSKVERIKKKQKVAHDLLKCCRAQKEELREALNRTLAEQNGADTNEAECTYHQMDNKEEELLNATNKLEKKLAEAELEETTKESDECLDHIEAAEERYNIYNSDDEDDE